MPILHFVNHKEKTVFARIIGDIPTNEVISSLRKLGESSKVPDNYNILIDLRQCRKSRSYDDAQRILDAWSFASSKYSQKCVFLASETVFWGEIRMTAALAELKGYDAHATQSEDEACELLGITTLPSDEQFARDGFEL
jgi:hypothetical protein